MEKILKGFKLFFKDLCMDKPVIHSDTLYSALTDALFKLGIFEGDITGNELIISSAFPFFANSCFLPMPVDFINFIPGAEFIPVSDYMYISQPLMETYFSGGLNDKSILQSGNFIAEKQDPIHSVYPFYFDCNILMGTNKLRSTRFKDGSGLFFLYETGENELFCALEFLKDEGFGKNRKLGRGCFNFEKFELPFNINNAGKYLLLSLYHPTLDEIKKGILANSAVKWIRREKKPFFYTDRESKYFLMAKEGSYITKEPEKNMGSLIKLFNPNKKLGTQTTILRSGKGFFLG